MRCRGPGFRFHPTDEELIMYYLKRKVMGRKFHCDGIRVLDVYKFAPWDLPGKARWTRDLKWYFFCPRERKYPTGERMNRSTGHGFWKTTGKDRQVHSNEEIVGMIKSLIFHTLNPTQCTNWVMHEYKLLDEDAFVVCVIFEKKGRGPRNGDQYGGPYRDEDWDDDNDCDTDDDEADDEIDNCREYTNVAGALTQVHIDKGKSTVTNDFERADGYWVGSSSRTLPSDNHGFPPTPVPGTLSMDSQLPLSDEWGMLVHEILSASLENEQVQDIGVDQDITCEPSIPANEEKIYDGLEDFCRLDDFDDSGVDAHVCEFLANIQPDDYLELADCIGDNVPYLNQHHPLALGPIGFGDQYFGENVPYVNPHHQFAQGPAAFVGQSLRENVSSLYGPQFAEDSVGLGVHGFEENVSHMNQHGQTADGSIGFHGQEASMNGQMDHRFDGVGTVSRGSPHYPS